MAKIYNTDNKKKYNFYSIMGIIGDIIFYPIIFITIFMCLAIYTDKQDNKVPSLFGVSMVNILSQSMEKAGFNKDEIVFLVKTNAEQLRVGDIIGFYPCCDRTFDCRDKLHDVQKINPDKTTTDYNTELLEQYRNNKRKIGRKSIDEIKDNTKIFFHRIVAILIKEDGTLFYETKGDNNPNKDGEYYDGYYGYFCEDYIIGKYSYTPEWLRSVFSFVSTPTGVVVTIIVPLSILILFILFSLIEQVSVIVIEGKVLKRIIRYDDEESINANIGIDMDYADKVKFYATTSPQDRAGVAKFLWGYLLTKGEAEKHEHSQIMNVLEYLDTQPKKYWLYFIGHTKKRRVKRQIEKAWQEWALENKMRENINKIKKQVVANKEKSLSKTEVKKDMVKKDMVKKTPPTIPIKKNK